MTVRTITVTIPEMLYLQLEASARASAQSLDTVVMRSLERSVPSHLSALLPPALQAELEAMEHLSDEALRAIAYSVAPPDRISVLDSLMTQAQAGTLTPEQQAQLTALRAESEALMVRKAHAFVLLKSRGYPPPSLDQLPVPPA